MVTAWILTVPAAGLIAFLVYRLTQLPTAGAWFALGALVAAFGG